MSNRLTLTRIVKESLKTLPHERCHICDASKHGQSEGMGFRHGEGPGPRVVEDPLTKKPICIPCLESSKQAKAELEQREDEEFGNFLVDSSFDCVDNEHNLE